MSAQYNIPPNEVASLEQNALNGDVAAAGKLDLYFGSYKGDLTQSIFWAQIAAENDEPYAQYNYAIILKNRSKIENSDAATNDKVRSCFWLRKALANGYSIKDVYPGNLTDCKIKQ